MLSIGSYLRHPSVLGVALLMRFNRFFPDEIYLKLLYLLQIGKTLNLKEPKTFTEKIQWLKLYNRKSEYTRMVDKLTSKTYVSNIVGQEYIIPTLGVWDKFEDIDFDMLPNQFVLKTNHSGGNTGVIICNDKLMFNKEIAQKKINASLKTNVYSRYREWPYKNIRPQIFAEKYMQEEGEKELKDYKFFCFNGEAKYCQLIANRCIDETIDFYDKNWIHQDFIGLNPNVHHANVSHIKPKVYNKMLELADKLSKGHPFLRVDFYYINSRIYFGELTFYPASGFGFFKPEEWNYKLGTCINLQMKYD